MNENKTNINWLACIYGVHQLSPYKMEVFKNWDLASFNKKRRKIWKKQVKIHSILSEIRVLACNMPTIFILIKRGEFEWV